MNQVLELKQGNAWLRFAPWLGARVTQCALEDAQGDASRILHPYPEHHADLLHWAKGGIYPLVPYSGRIDRALLHVGTQAYQLQPHPQALPHTLHGTAHLKRWTLSDLRANTAAMRLDHLADPGWPWSYRVELRLLLEPRALHVNMSLSNASAQPMPAGIGLHPYLSRPKDLQLQFDASNCWPPTTDMLALQPAAVDSNDDFTAIAPVGDRARTQFYAGWPGRIRLVSADRDWLEIRATPVLDHLVLHQPEQPLYLCLEPVSHVADAFNLAYRGVAGTGARMLAPGASLSAGVTFRSSRNDDDRDGEED